MSDKTSIKNLLGQTDIYLLDQIMKGRYAEHDKIIDIGCGPGRNMHWFLQNEFDTYAIDTNEELINQLKISYPHLPADRFQVASVEKIPFADNYFDHVICIAVLHFATSTKHFKEMLAEVVRIVKPGGSMLFRIAANIGFEDKIELVSEGVYTIPDGSQRFLLHKKLLADCMQENNLSFLEPFKTVNVNDLRCMSTLVLQKN